MTRQNFCTAEGCLVGMRYPLASDPTEYELAGGAGIVGCTRIRCSICNSYVRAEPGWNPESEAGRRYQCNCTIDPRGGIWVEASVKYLEHESEEYALPWSCDGHPLVEMPFELDGESIEQTTDFLALVTRTLAGWAPAAARPVERETPAGWALKLWGRLRSTGLENEVARAAGECLRSNHPHLRAWALRFFDRAGESLPGSERIEDVADAADEDPLDAVADPTHVSTVPLGVSVRIGLSKRIQRLYAAGADPGRALAIAKKLILQPSRASGLVTAVSESHWSWFQHHAEAIVSATPAACGEVLMAFSDAEDAGELAARVSAIPGIDTDELLMWAECSLSENSLADVKAAIDTRARRATQPLGDAEMKRELKFESLEEALAHPGKLVAAWDGRWPNRAVLGIYATSDSGATQIYTEEFPPEERQTVQHHLRDSAARIGDAYSYTGHVWALDSQGVGVWTSKASLVEGNATVLRLKSGAIKTHDVTKVLTFVDPHDTAHRGVNCQMAAGVVTLLDERDDAETSKSFCNNDELYDDMRWAIMLGHDVAMWLRVPHVDQDGDVTNASELEVAKAADGLADTIEKLPPTGEFEDVLQLIGTFGSIGPVQFRLAPGDLTGRFLELRLFAKQGPTTARRIEQGTNEQLAAFLRDVRTPGVIMDHMDEMAGRAVR